jgi:hypothetical protein
VKKGNSERFTRICKSFLSGFSRFGPNAEQLAVASSSQIPHKASLGVSGQQAFLIDTFPQSNFCELSKPPLEKKRGHFVRLRSIPKKRGKEETERVNHG